MKSRDINNMSIKQYLSEKGILPAKDRGYYGMYSSPFREDHEASMKVDYNKNLWIDYGSGEGGSLIDLVMKMNNATFHEAITLLEKEQQKFGSLSFHGDRIYSNPETLKSTPAIIIRRIQKLTNPALIDYLKERKINTDIACIHCSEVHYLVNDKSYFAVGFKNDSGGYELRNKYFKGCTSKDITFIKADNDCCQLFEGFMDYLSFLTLKNCENLPLRPMDVIVLNSLTNLPKAKKVLASYKSVSLFLDNDNAGKRAVQELKSVCKEVNDQSSFYTKHKDLNDYLNDHLNDSLKTCLCEKTKVEIPVKNKKSGIKR